MIKGITITLYEKIKSGVDDFNHAVYTETPVEIENVLVTPVSADDLVSLESLYGKKAVYQIAIPKGDTHNFEDAVVEFFGEKWHVFGFPQTGIEEMIPLNWNTKWSVERYG